MGGLEITRLVNCLLKRTNAPSLDARQKVLDGDPIQATYLAIRKICPFLTDNNHDWEAKDYGPCKEEHRRLKEYMQSSRYRIYIIRKLGSEHREHWFHFCYRVPGEEF